MGDDLLEDKATFHVMAKRDFRTGRLGLVVLVAAGVTACASRAGLETSAAPVDPNSRIGQAMIEAMRNPGPYPKFSDIPKVPADMAQAKTTAEVTAPVLAQAAALRAQVAALPEPSRTQELTDRDAARLRALAAMEPPPANAAAQAEAFAQSLRRRATPPPAPR